MREFGATIVGLGLIGLVLHDLYATLFEPQGSGRLSSWLQRAIWRLLTRTIRRPQRLAIAGPLGMVATIGAWVVFAAVGWALVLWPRLPGGFRIASGLAAEEQDSFLDALYVSTVTLATLGYGDLSPRSTALRLLLPAEALVGFALLSGAITWVLSVTPALARQRAFARLVTQLDGATDTAGLTLLSDEAHAALLADLSARLRALHADLAQLPVVYYFRVRDRRFALPAALKILDLFAVEALGRTGAPAVALHGALLDVALADLTDLLGRHFVPGPGPGEPRDAVLAAYAADQRWEPTPAAADR